MTVGDLKKILDRYEDNIEVFRTDCYAHTVQVVFVRSEEYPKVCNQNEVKYEKRLLID